MLCLLALIGNEEKAEYSVVIGTASVDASTGENYFTVNSDGPHKYVVKQKEDTYYADAINKLIKTNGI